MFFTLLLAALAAAGWTLWSAYDTHSPHDPTTLELAAMAAVSLAAYAWSRRVRGSRTGMESSTPTADPGPPHFANPSVRRTATTNAGEATEHAA